MDTEKILQDVSTVARQYLREQAFKIDEAAVWPEEAIRALQSGGLAGLTVPTRYGGLGGGLLSLVQSSEILGRDCASVAMCFGMHCVASAVISAKATEEQIEQFLKPICRGEHFTTLSLSEPGTGAHFYIPETELKSNSDGSFTIEGRKSFITNGGHADSYVVSAVAAESDAPLGQFSMVLVPKETAGLHWKSPWNGFGMRGNASCDADLKGIHVAAQNLLGKKGDQLWYVFEVVAPYFLMAMAGTYLGVASEAIDEAIAHLKSRRFSYNGSGLGNVSVLQHRLGALWSRLESTRQLIYHAARLGDAGRADALPAILSSKAEMGDTATFILNEVMTLLGGKGYAESGKIGRLLRDVRAIHVMSPTTDMLRTWAGRALIGAPLLSEEV